MCCGVVPQQPPTMSILYSSMKRRMAMANASARNGYSVRPSSKMGKPAFGITLTARSQCFAKYAICSAISTGPVAQFKPKLAIGNGFNALTTAAMSLPSNMVPVVSMVTLTKIGMSFTVRPDCASASMHALMAHFTCNKSWHVSIMKQSTPPSINPSACSQ